MHVAYSRDELAPEQVAVLKAVPGWLWAFPPASLDIDTADEADLARWFKNDDDFQIWMTAHAAWLDRDTSDTAVENAKVAVATEPGLADELGIVIERPSTPEPDLDDEIDYYKEKNEDPTEDYPEGLVAHFVDRASWDSRNIPGGLWILTFPAPDDAPEGPIGWDYSDEFVGDSGRAAVQAIVEANLELDVA